MNSPADDRRVRKTKKALRQGLVKLLAKKSLKDISVRELTDEVDLHRGTFYVHYRDIYDLYDQMLQEALQEIQAIFERYPPEDLVGGPAPILRAVMEYAWENRDLCQMLFRSTGDQSLIQELTGLLEEKCEKNWPIVYPGATFVHDEYLRIYVVGGWMGMVRRWVDSGMKESPQHMVALLERVTKSATDLFTGG